MASDETLPDTTPDELRRRAVPSASYLIVALACERPLAPPTRLSLADVDEVVIGRAAHPGHRRTGRRLEVRIDDRRMSSTHARLERTGGGWSVADAGSKNGTFLQGAAVAEPTPAVDGAILEAGRTVFLFRSAVPAAGDRAVAIDELSGGDPITLSPGFDTELRRLRAIAPTELPVLVLGDTGTGKEVAARALHERSGRPGPLVDVNCGALPESLIESELFGHERGAFSGADSARPGLVRAADRGTLLLDEVAELPLPAQATLLRVLQDRRVRPVGGHEATEVDVRVVAATLQDLEARVREGSFREDLYARLAGAVVRLPPLRERPEDIGLLIATLLPRIAGDAAGAVRLSRPAARALLSYEWPRNVRELEHALAAALAFAGDAEIEASHLPDAVQSALAPRERRARAPEHTLERQLDELLRDNRGNVAAVARTMGKAPMQIYRWLRRFGIDVDGYRS